MAIKNYTTSVDAAKTVGEIVSMLARVGARRIQQQFTLGRPGELEALEFSLVVDGHELAYRIEPRVEGVLKALIRDRVEPRFRNNEHALKVAWRIEYHWLEAQFAKIDAGAAAPAEIFLPFMIQKGGRTVWQIFQQQRLALPPGQDEEVAGEIV